MKQIIIWTIPDCPECERIKAMFSDAEIRDLQPIMDGAEKDMEVITQLAMQNMAAPVVRVGEDFIQPRSLK